VIIQAMADPSRRAV